MKQFLFLFMPLLLFCIVSCKKEGTFTDTRDGQTYKTVKLNQRWWMAESLNYKPDIGESWCYEDDEEKCKEYGRFYNWKTAMSVCPSGWHLPNLDEWKSLIAAKENQELSGISLKEKHSQWTDSTNKLINNSGFSALPSGYRNYHGFYLGLGEVTKFWSSTEGDSYVFTAFLSDNSDELSITEQVPFLGLNVRCIKDQK